MDRRDFLSLAAGGLGVAVHAGLAGRAVAGATVDALSAPVRDVPRRVFLTFDDGPGAATKKVRRILESHDVRGTFFVVGRMARYVPSTLRSLSRDGHSIQNHSWSHPYLTQIPHPRRELKMCSDLVADATGISPRFFRPPFGDSNARVKAVGKSLGMEQIMWNLSATPPLAHKYPAWRFSRRIDEVLEDSPYIWVLFHDGSGDTDRMTFYLPAAINSLRQRGFEFDVM